MAGWAQPIKRVRELHSENLTMFVLTLSVVNMLHVAMQL
jgi:hypothetical protein